MLRTCTGRLFILGIALLQIAYAVATAQIFPTTPPTAHAGYGYMTNAMLTPDNSKVLATSEFGTVIFDAQTGELDVEISEWSLYGRVYFSEDAKTCYLYGRTVDTATWEATAEAEAMPFSTIVGGSPDGRLILGIDMASRFGQPYIFDLYDTAEHNVYSSFTLSVDPEFSSFCADISLDYSLVAFGDGRGERLHLIDIPSGQVVHSQNFELSGSRTGKFVHFSADGTMLAVASSDGVTLFDVSGTGLTERWSIDTGAPTDILFRPVDSELLFFRYNRLYIADLADGTIKRTDTLPKDGYAEVTFSRDGKYIVGDFVDNFDRPLGVVKLEDLSVVSTMRGHSENTIAAGYSPTSGTMVCLSYYGAIHESDPVRGIHRGVEELPYSSMRAGYFVSSPEEMIIGGAYDSGQVVYVHKLQDNTPDRIIATSHTETIKAIVLSQDASLIMTGADDEDGTCQLIDFETGTQVRVLDPGYEFEITSVAISPDNSLCAAGDAEGNLTVWRVEDGTTTFTVKVDSSDIEALTFSHNGQFLFVSTDYKTVLYNTHTGTTKASSSDGRFTDAVFSQDDSLILAGHSGTFLLRTEGLKRIRSFHGAGQRVTFLPGEESAMGVRAAAFKTWNFFNETTDSLEEDMVAIASEVTTGAGASMGADYNLDGVIDAADLIARLNR